MANSQNRRIILAGGQCVVVADKRCGVATPTEAWATMLVGPWLESGLISSITTLRDVFFQSSIPMSVSRSFDVRLDRVIYHTVVGATACLVPGVRSARGGIGRELCFGIKSDHFAPWREDSPRIISRVDYHRLSNIITGERPSMRSETQVAFGVTDGATVVACP